MEYDGYGSYDPMSAFSNMDGVRRYNSCSHSGACDRMAEIARISVWYGSGEDSKASVSMAYGCKACDMYSPYPYCV